LSEVKVVEEIEKPYKRMWLLRWVGMKLKR
jgi:hypothetical protein